MTEALYPPWNFSWVTDRKLAAMGWPQTEANVNYIIQEGITNLVTLSPEMVPPAAVVLHLRWTLIPVQEFEAPTLHQMKEFISICEHADMLGEAVGVHCRMGRGRTGVMAACYLIRFQGLSPDRAITSLRKMRPGSVETYSQEKAVKSFYDNLMGTKLK